MIGYFIWCWNDEELLERCLSSFRETTKDIYLFGICNGSTDSSIHSIREYCDDYIAWGANTSMSFCVNTGYETLYDKECHYMGWIHPDCTFSQKGWVDVLADTLSTYTKIGRISPSNIKHTQPEPSIYPGAEAGNLIPVKIYEQTGGFDESYLGCGGYEDWDFQRKLIQLGLGNCITTDAEIYHEHAGTRLKIDSDKRYNQWAYNQQIYYTKWKTYDNAMVPDGWTDIPLVG